jgi:hypothetical protein
MLGKGFSKINKGKMQVKKTEAFSTKLNFPCA